MERNHSTNGGNRYWYYKIKERNPKTRLKRELQKLQRCRHDVAFKNQAKM